MDVFVTLLYLPHKDKFAPRALKCTFIRYSPRQKAYKLYDIVTSKILISQMLFSMKMFSVIKVTRSEKVILLPCITVDEDVHLQKTVVIPITTTGSSPLR